MNNTITGNADYGFYNYYANATPVLTNNIFWGNRWSIGTEGSSTQPLVTYCLIQEDALPSGIQGNSEGCIFRSSPQVGDDYSIPFNSPCVNMGKADTTGLKVCLVDHLGQNRVTGGRIDMGAYEFQGADRMVVLSPNGREGWMGGSVRNILWRGNAANVKLEYTDNNGSSWNTIVGNTANTGTYSWTLPAIESQRCRVRVSDASKASVADQSDTTFTVITSVIPANTMLTGRLTLANSPYTINGLVTIPKGDSLIIEPGVVLKFKTGTDYTFSSSADTISVG